MKYHEAEALAGERAACIVGAHQQLSSAATTREANEARPVVKRQRPGPAGAYSAWVMV
ncbi:hypothetical protein [Hymenobacter sp. NBH84]|uniref:hypothetical protein n=1 Tax=Hymenobacter sp. NBH84 TaxID=2596915 RepID=UPI001626BFE9|nr:hypothetical protein [Hymenobacter sp. NBH84]